MKQTLPVFSPAKVNLQLEIGECRADGFHQAKSIMQALTLHDMVTVVLDDGVDAYLNPDGFNDFAIDVTCTTFEGIPELDVAPESNIAYKAAAALAEKLGHEQGHISIHIEKHIPFEAGLGGGSSNAAYAAFVDTPSSIFTRTSVPRVGSNVRSSTSPFSPSCTQPP